MIPCANDPVALLLDWLGEARGADVALAERVALATVNASGQPSVRMVLLKGCSQDGFDFYTSLMSRKAADLAENPKAALCFHWPELKRQVRAEGSVEPVRIDEADTYFASRPRESQLGAWASAQSAVLHSREELLDRFDDVTREYAGREVPRPPFWSGFRLKPVCIEFWQEMPHRLHDRLLYGQTDSGVWKAERLYP